MIRHARSSDMGAMIALCRDFHARSPYARFPFDGSKCEATLVNILATPEDNSLWVDDAVRRLVWVAFYEPPTSTLLMASLREVVCYKAQQGRMWPMVRFAARRALKRAARVSIDQHGYDEKTEKIFNVLGFRREQTTYAMGA